MKRLLPIALLLLVACQEPFLEALTVPPTGKEARMDAIEHRVVISKGVALGFRCSYSGPCSGAAATLDDGNLATVLPAYLDNLQATYNDGIYSGRAAQSGFVLLGRVEGRTTLRVTADDDLATEYEVEIVP